MRLYTVQVNGNRVIPIRAPNANEARWRIIEDYLQDNNERPSSVAVTGYYTRNTDEFHPIIEGRQYHV